MGRAAPERREKLVELYNELKDCRLCPLAGSRTNVVFGAGNADAELMFVGEAPGFHEDQQARPFVGAAGKLLDTLLGEIGMKREDVMVVNVLKCRPPGNRDPLPEEIEACRPFLMKQVELVEPRVICTLGNFSTKLLTRRQDGITRVHGRPQDHVIAGVAVRIYPIYHPAAGLRSAAMLETLREDFKQLPELLEAARPRSREPAGGAAGLDAGAGPGGRSGGPDGGAADAAGGSLEPVAASQLGLFA